MNRLTAWWLAARPATLTASAAPVVVGTGVAIGAGVFAWGPALGALTGAMLLQLGANFANDVYDHERGADTEERLGPARATQQGWIAAASMKRAMVLAFALAIAVGVYLAMVSSWGLFAIGLVAVAAGYLYTGGPKPYGYVGLGDLSVFLFFGLFAVAGSYYVQAKAVSLLALLAAVPIGALATAILAINNLRDIDTDARAGKRTLAVRIGAEATRAYIALLFVVAYALPPLLWLAGLAQPQVLAPLATLPWALALIGRIRREQGLALNGCLVRTAKLELAFAVLFALGLAW